MPRKPRIDVGGEIYHVHSRAEAKRKIFRSLKDYKRFIEILEAAIPKFEMRLLAYCLMPNHWHLLLWPRKDGDLSRFMQWISATHARRYHVRKGSVGTGHVYQGRYKSHLVQCNQYLMTACRYVERNALTSSLVERAEDWRWGSLFWRTKDTSDPGKKIIHSFPLDLPSDWVSQVNLPLTEKEKQRLKESIRHEQPFGDLDWSRGQFKKHGIVSPYRRPGRPLSKNGA